MSRTARTIVLLYLACALPTGALFAQEADYLRLGMRPHEAASVYTSLRSCSNAPFEEAPDRMSWEGPLYGGYALIEIRFGPMGAESIGYRISPNSSASAMTILATVIADRELAHGPATSDTSDGAEWLLPGFKLTVRTDGTEVVMLLIRLPSHSGIPNTQVRG